MSTDDAGFSLSSLLEQLTLQELREIGRQHGWHLRARTRAEYVAIIADQLLRPEVLARAVAALPNPLREALRAGLVAEDGSGITAPALAHVTTAIRGRQGPPLKAVEASAVLSDLARWGLVFPWREVRDGLPRYVFPRQLQRELPSIGGWCSLPSPPSSGACLAVAKAAIVGLVHSLSECLASGPPGAFAVEQRAHDPWSDSLDSPAGRPSRVRRRANDSPDPVPVPKPGYWLTPDSAGRLAQHLLCDEEQLDLALRLMGHLGLISGDGGHLGIRSEACERFFQQPLAQQYTAIGQAYLSLTTWSEVDALLRHDAALQMWRTVHFSFTTADCRSQLLNLRMMLLRLLASASDSCWCSVSALIASLRMLWPDFSANLRTQSPKWQPRYWWIGLALPKDEQVAGGEVWDRVQGALLLTLLQGPLFWLGLAQLHWQGDQLVAVRTDDLGRLISGRPFEGLDEPPQPLSVDYDPSKKVLTLCAAAVPANVHAVLGTIGTPLGTSHDTVCYQVDPAVVLGVFSRGERLGDILSLWDRAIPTPMPTELKALLERWAEQYGRVRIIGGMAILQVADEITMRELEVTTSLRHHIVASLSPCSVVIRDDAVETLRQELAVVGRTAKQEHAG